jgi:hypothetical protein
MQTQLVSLAEEPPSHEQLGLGYSKLVVSAKGTGHSISHVLLDRSNHSAIALNFHTILRAQKSEFITTLRISFRLKIAGGHVLARRAGSSQELQERELAPGCARIKRLHR